jgi:hypothetical protein
VYFKITFDADYVGIHEASQTPVIGIYFNPTTGDLYFNSTTRIVKATVQDLDGKTVLSESVNFSVLHTDRLSPAVYIIQLTNEKGQVVRQRFIKQ